MSALAVLMPALAAAQGSSLNTFSPYTLYGIGERASAGNSALQGMGGAGLGYRNPLATNTLNPASYSYIARQSALFHIGGQGQNFYMTSGDAKSSFNTFNLREISLQLPLAGKLGFAFSMSPYSAVGYRITSEEDTPGLNENIGVVRNFYDGSGGINQFKAGVGWQVGRVSVGAEAVYYHGDIVRNSSQAILNITGEGTYASMSTDNSEYISRFFADFGIQASLLEGRTSLTLGATYSLGGALNSKIHRRIVGPTLADGPTNVIRDEVSRSDFKLPNIVGVGLTMMRGGVLASADYRYGAWGVNAGTTDGAMTVGYKDTHSVNAGLQYTPNADDVRRAMNRWSYRIGARYEQSYMTFNGLDMDEKALSIGVGIPMGRRRINHLDLGLEFGTMGHNTGGMIQQNFLKFSVGFTLFGEDYWFRKIQFD